MDILALLANMEDAHETQQLEFKEAAAGLPDDLWETYSAFANTEGGDIVLGVREDVEAGAFHADGVTDAQGLTAEFWSTLRNSQRVERDVMLYDGVRVVPFEGKNFVVINVPRADRSEKPVRVYDRRTKQFVAWVRREEGDFKATDADIRLMHYDSIPAVDRKPLENFSLEALCPETIRRYRNLFAALKGQSPWVDDSDEDFLYHIGALAKGHDGAFHPTQAGLLAFGYEYEITNYSPHYLLDYRQETSGLLRYDDRVVSQSGDWSGNLIDFYFTVSERLLRWFKSPFTTDETGMVHGVRNPVTEAVNEAVANALVHAYYGATGSVRVILREDALRIYNPGSFLVDRDVAIAGGFSEARNPTLMRIFNFVGVSDRMGSGLQKIWSTWEEHFGAAPSLAEEYHPACITLVLPVGEEPPVQVEERLSKSWGSLSDEAIVAAIVEAGHGMTSQELAEVLGVSLRVAQIRLKNLHKERRLERLKEGRSYRYSQASSQ